MEYLALLRDLQRHVIPPVILLHGGEVLLADDVLRLLTLVLFPDPALAALDREILDAREGGVELIVRSAQTLPFVASRRLVVVRHAEALAAKASEPLAAHVAAPSPTTCLLLTAGESLRADRTRRNDHWLLRAVPATATVELVTPRGPALERSLRRRAQLDGLEVTDDAAKLLVEFVGDDLARLLGEIHKAALAGGPDNRRVDVAEVSAVVGESRLRGLFELTSAVERGDGSRAIALLEGVVASGEEPLVILALLTRHVRSLWLARQAGDGVSVPALARRLGVPIPVAERLLGRARETTLDELARRLDRCWQVERRAKSGGRLLAELTTLVTDLCPVGAGAAHLETPAPV